MNIRKWALEGGLTRKQAFIGLNSALVFYGLTQGVFSLADTVIILYLGLLISKEVPEGVNEV